MKLGLSPGLGLVSPSKASLLKNKIADQGPAELAKRVTRSSPATCIGPDGTVQWGPHNLLGESLSATLFVAGGTTPPTVTDYQTFAGELCTSALFTSAMTAGYAGTRFARGYADGAPCVQNKSYIQSNYIGLSRALTGSESIILYWTGSFATNTFTITAANSSQFVGVLTRAPVAASVCTVTGNIYPVVYLGSALSSNLTVYTNKGMMEDVTGTNRTTPSPYVDSTVGNRLGYSNDFTNAAWTKTNATSYANLAVQANGVPATLLCDNSTSGLHYIRQNVTVTAGVWSVTIRAKQASLGFLWISMDGASNITWFNLATGAVGTNNNGTPLIVLGSDGFYTITLTRTLSAGTAAHFIGVSNADGVSTYTGSGNGVYIANAGVVPGAIATYTYNPFAAPTGGPIYSGRTDYDPVTLASKGTLIEEARTNLLLNSATPATQTVTVTTQSYTVSFWGTGTCTLTGTASGTLTGSGTNVRSTLTVSATAGAVLCTFSGSTTNGQIEAGLNATSYIPTAGATVTRIADTALIGFDNLAQVWPWVMDANLLASKSEDFSAWSPLISGTGVAPVVTTNDASYLAPDGTVTADKVVFNVGAGSTSSDYSFLSASGLITTTSTPYTSTFKVMGAAGTQILFRHVGAGSYGTVTCSGLGIWDNVPARTETATGSSSDIVIGIRQTTVGTATVWLWGAKLNPGPIAQTYYPNSVKQATTVVEFDANSGVVGSAVVLAFASNPNFGYNLYPQIDVLPDNRVRGLFTDSAGSTVSSVTQSGYVSRSLCKVAVGFTTTSTGIVKDGSTEVTASLTSMPKPTYMTIGGLGGSAQFLNGHIKRLRLLTSNLTAAGKQGLT